MIFLCFSVQDRIPLINNFVHYLENFGLVTWYDRKNIFWGDDRQYVNIEQGASNADVNYAIVFYSENFKNGNICLEEYRILVERYYNNEVHIFPVFIGKIPNNLDEKFTLLKKLVYKEISSEDDFFKLALHIVAKISNDRLSDSSIKTIRELLDSLNSDNLLFELLNEYENISKENYHMRISMLFSIFKAITYCKNSDYFHKKTMNFIFYSNCYNVRIIEEKREIQIMENIVIAESLRLFSILPN
ncbi:MAG: toll/interleukin-1 receptor domain-containing protein [Clostridia bacterium]|nr:toll/interleukin-1 receptor domain-containing protein [Clostridia bacterium]